MFRSTITLTLAITLLLAIQQPRADSHTAEDGEVRSQNDRQQAWDGSGNEWVSLDEFWRRYADRRGGLTWGSSREYPQYDKVKEHDTFLVELDSGTCLMEFFHTRWRRANDVRRWDDAFNDYSGCPHVFD